MTNVSCVSDNHEDPLESLIVVVDVLVLRDWFSPNVIPYFRCVNFRSVALRPWDGMEFWNLLKVILVHITLNCYQCDENELPFDLYETINIGCIWSERLYVRHLLYVL